MLIATFLIPSFLYWASGLHKEGLIFTGIALIVYHFYFGFKDRRFTINRILIILLGFALILILRNFLIVTLIPPIIAWILSEKLRFRPLYVYGITTVLFVIIFFSAKYIHPKLDFAQATVTKQGEFLDLGGGSAVEVSRLEPDFKSFVSHTPQALSLSIIRPYPSDVKHLLSLAAALEINLLQRNQNQFNSTSIFFGMCKK